MESTSAATSVISRRLDPSPTAITNLPPEKPTIFPFTLLPSFIRMVSANAPSPKQRTTSDRIDARTTFDLNDITTSRGVRFGKRSYERPCCGSLRISTKKDAKRSRFVGLKKLTELYIF